MCFKKNYICSISKSWNCQTIFHSQIKHQFVKLIHWMFINKWWIQDKMWSVGIIGFRKQNMKIRTNHLITLPNFWTGLDHRAIGTVLFIIYKMYKDIYRKLTDSLMNWADHDQAEWMYMLIMVSNGHKSKNN